MKEKIIAPSILASDFANLERDIKMVEQAGAEILHIDVMDGHFVPNISFGIPVLKAIKRVATKPCDVHLMISNPELYIDAFANAGADYITVHVETAPHLHRVIQQIKAHNIKAGVVLNPHTPLNTIEEILHELDMVLLMSVNPGFGGQSFIPSVLDKTKRLKQILIEKGLEHIKIEIDGGIKIDNIKQVADAGADILVSGSGIFNAKNPTEMIKKMKLLVNS
ncbi:MAG: ribulose-phosphate 3-epimerase [Tenacibaculum sp.]|nr:ribulose-phosphate 3-epimerase [Tenacibaculum sp.]